MVVHGAWCMVHGFVETRASVTQLNRHVVDALRGAGVPACGLSPCGVWATRGGQVADDGAGVAAARALLAAGLVPVLHGDAVLDQTQGCTILSGAWCRGLGGWGMCPVAGRSR